MRHEGYRYDPDGPTLRAAVQDVLDAYDSLTLVEIGTGDLRIEREAATRLFRAVTALRSTSPPTLALENAEAIARYYDLPLPTVRALLTRGVA